MSEEPAKTSLSMGDLKKMMQDTVKDIVSSLDLDDKPKEEKEDDKPKGAVADQVRAEIEKIRAREKADEKARTIDDQLAKLTEATKERPPVERRRVHKWMGWGE